jgi:hypothetical protein
MKRTFITLLGIMLLLTLTTFTGEQTEQKEPDLTIGILSYMHYVYDLDTDADFNAFEITRNYIDIKYNYSDTIRFRLTPDFFRQGDGPLEGIIKYAYVEFKNPLGLENQTFRIGMNPTAWEGYLNDWWGFRWIEKTPSGTWKMTTSSDLGITLLGNLLDKFVSYQVSLSNGEGYNGSPEADSAKAFEATVDLLPIKEMPIHFFGHVRLAQEISEIESDDNLYAGAVYYKDSSLRLGAEYLSGFMTGVDNSLMSFIFAVNLDQFVILGRYDIFDPSTDVDNNKQNLIIAGVGYQISKNVQAMLDVKIKTYEDDSHDSDTKIYFHWEFKF